MQVELDPFVDRIVWHKQRIVTLEMYVLYVGLLNIDYFSICLNSLINMDI